MKQTTSNQAGPSRVVGLIAGLGALTAFALAPPVFSAIFAVGPLLTQQRVQGWIFAILVVLFFGWLAARKSRVSKTTVGFALALLVLVWIELGARLVVRVFLPSSTSEHLSWLATGTYPEKMILKGHPFLHYASQGEGNSLGFPTEREFERPKPAGVLRIACLGGSTTAAKWPETLEQMLNTGDPESVERPRYEVLDFGQNGYSSAHLVVNFILNALDYAPDYVILHTGWNDSVMRGKGSEIRSDFSDVFKTFEYPTIRDRWAIRLSVLYRGLQYRLYQQPAWANIRNALDVVSATPTTFDDLSELVPFRRNLTKIIDLAAARGIKVILATQPHTTDSNVEGFEEAKHIDQCNDVVRAIAKERSTSTLLVDMDATMTGKFDKHFFDLGHMDDEGRRFKAELLARSVRADRREAR